MPYIVTFCEGFTDDLLAVHRHVGEKFSAVDALLRQNPTSQPNVKRLKGFSHCYRYRVGDYRLIYSVQGNVIQYLMIGPRGSIYDRLNYDPDAPDEKAARAAEAVLFPSESAENRKQADSYWSQRGPTRRAATTVQSKALPLALTAARLAEWNIAPEHHAALSACRTDDDLLNANVPQDVLMRVLNIVYPPGVEELAAQPVRVLSRSEDVDLYLEGKLSDFLLKLDEDQEKLVGWSLDGPVLVKGGPGSGKSTVALYRVAAMQKHARQHGQPVPRILFTTYTKTLINVSEQLLDRLLDNNRAGVEIKTIDSVAFDLATKAGLSRNTRRPTTAQWADALVWARQQVAQQSPPLNRLMVERQLQIFSDQFLQEEFEQVIEGRGLSTEQEYFAAERAGRRTGLRQTQRAVIFQLYALAKQRLHAQNLYTYGDVRLRALQGLRQNSALSPRYAAVIVDEAQDLSPIALQLAAALAADSAGLYLTADLSQSIYNRGFSLAKALPGLDVTRRTRVLRQNYRTTTEICAGRPNCLAARAMARPKLRAAGRTARSRC